MLIVRVYEFSICFTYGNYIVKTSVRVIKIRSIVLLYVIIYFHIKSCVLKMSSLDGSEFYSTSNVTSMMLLLPYDKYD